MLRDKCEFWGSYRELGTKCNRWDWCWRTYSSGTSWTRCRGKIPIAGTSHSLLSLPCMSSIMCFMFAFCCRTSTRVCTSLTNTQTVSDCDQLHNTLFVIPEWMRPMSGEGRYYLVNRPGEAVDEAEWEHRKIIGVGESSALICQDPQPTISSMTHSYEWLENPIVTDRYNSGAGCCDRVITYWLSPDNSLTSLCCIYNTFHCFFQLAKKPVVFWTLVHWFYEHSTYVAWEILLKKV